MELGAQRSGEGVVWVGSFLSRLRIHPECFSATLGDQDQTQCGNLVNPCTWNGVRSRKRGNVCVNVTGIGSVDHVILPGVSVSGGWVTVMECWRTVYASRRCGLCKAIPRVLFRGFWGACFCFCCLLKTV